ncbi:MAG: LLM class flavin-dependent oxidoreductase [Gammaproteobacteria bacterium]|nr:LLM class flavin-dependent oxidoreductase [Gammaproteobacteria bacterium]
MQIDVILDSRARAQDLAQLGLLAEQQGLSGVWVSSLNDSRDPFTNLSALAQATSRIALGPIAVNPFDIHPLRIASALLTLNEIAAGRARIVVGGGGEALEALGLVPHRRVRAVRECVEIMKLAASGGAVDFAGELYQVRNCRFGWLEAPAPAVYVGASQSQMLRMAAGVADGIMMSDMPPEPAEQAIATLDAALARAGRSRPGTGVPGFRTNVFIAWHVYEDEAEARREARRWLFLRGIFRPWLLASFLAPEDVQLVMASRAAFARAFVAGRDVVEGVPESVLDALVDNVTLCTTPANIERAVTRLGDLRDAGLGGVALRLYANPAASIRLIGKRVLPALR